MKKQLKLLFFVAMLVTLVVMTMLVSSAEVTTEKGDKSYYQLTQGEVTKYATTLKEAVGEVDAESADAAIITLLKSTTETETVSIDKNLTLKGTTGAVITVKLDNANWIEVGAATVNVEGLVAKRDTTDAETEKNYRTLAFFAMVGAGTLNVDGCDLDNCIQEVSATEHGYVSADATPDIPAPLEQYAVFRFEVAEATINAHNTKAVGFHVFHIKVKGYLNVYSGEYYSKGLAAGSLATDYDENRLNENGNPDTSAGEGTVIRANTGCTSSVVNIYGGTLKGYRACIRINYAITVNIYGGELSHTHTSETAGTIFFYSRTSTVKMYGGTISPLVNAAVTWRKQNASKFYLYGGTINSSTAQDGIVFRTGTVKETKNDDGTVTKTWGALVLELGHSGNPVTYSYEDWDGNTVSGTTDGGTLNVTRGKAFSSANTAAKYNIYNNVKIKLSGTGSLGTIKNAATLKMTYAFHYYPMNGDAPPTWLDCSKAIFHLNAVTAELGAGTYSFSSFEDACNKVGDCDVTLKEWNLTTYGGVVYEDITAFRLIVGKDVNVTFTNGEYLDLLPNFLTIEGGKVTISGGTYKAASGFAASECLIELVSGELYITDKIDDKDENGNDIVTRFEADWTVFAFMIYVRSGKLGIDCDSSNHTPRINDFENDYAASEGITDANFLLHTAGAVVFVNNTITTTTGEDGKEVKVVSPVTVTVEDAVFLHMIANDGGTDRNGFMIYTGGTFTQDIQTSITITDGYYYSNVITYISTQAYTDVTDKETGTTTRTHHKGVVLTLEGGTFVSNACSETNYARAYMFMIVNRGGNKVAVAENADVTVYASKWTLNVFYANTNADGDNGATWEILGGTYYIVQRFFYSTTSFTNVTFTLKNATITQRPLENLSVLYNTTSDYKDAVCNKTPDTLDVIYLRDTESAPGGKVATVENVTIIANNGPVFGLGDARLSITINSGFFSGDVIVSAVSKNAAPAITVNGGTFVAKAASGNLFGYATENVSDTILVLATEDVIYRGEKAFDAYAPEVKYGGGVYKFWAKGIEASTSALTMKEGAGLYLGEDGLGETEENCGLRFTSSFNVGADAPAGYTWVMLGGEETGIGHLIAPADYVAALMAQGKAFTHKNLEDLKKETPALADKTVLLDIPATMDNLLPDETGDIYSFAAAIYDLKSTTRAYAAIPYAKAVSDSDPTDVIYVYGAFDIIANSRSAEQISCYQYNLSQNYFNAYPVFGLYYNPQGATTPETGDNN